MRNWVYLIACITLTLQSHDIFSQNLDLKKIPKPAHLASAKEMAKGVFDNFENQKHQEIADFIVESIGYNWDDSKKITQRNDYLAKLEIISLKPPNGVFGDMFGYDLIEEGFISGSDRYFRHTYISYHDGSILLWEFRFFVDKIDKVRLHYIGWSDKNPFEYLSTPDMVLPRSYE